ADQSSPTIHWQCEHPVISGACSHRSRNSSNASLLTIAYWLTVSLQQQPQSVINPRLALFSRQLQNLQIEPDFPELTSWKQVFSTVVAGKRRLASAAASQ